MISFSQETLSINTWFTHHHFTLSLNTVYKLSIFGSEMRSDAFEAVLDERE